MKLVLEPIQVTLDAHQQPQRVLWRLHAYRIQAIRETWTYRGKWWSTPALRGHRRLYYRVECLSPLGHALALEIYYQRGRWMLSQVLD